MASYTKGLHEVGEGTFAYLQPDGGWGWSNAGLVVADGEAMLVDTLFDLPLTQEMLDAMAPQTKAAPIRTLVNTHANGDHTYGNELVVGAEIIASTATAEELERVTPAVLAGMVATDFGDEIVNEYVRDAFGPFAFDGITLTAPTSTFSGTRTVDVGGVTVELVEVGPAHTDGDVLAFVPERGTVFTGDILFIDGTPIVWVGPVSNWLAACDRIIESGCTTVVPGHGPVTDEAGVRQVADYLRFLETEVAERHAAGMSARDAAFDIDLGSYADWGDPERIVINVDAMYRQLDPTHQTATVVAQFSAMAHWRADRR